jgi:hypothetical protein
MGEVSFSFEQGPVIEGVEAFLAEIRAFTGADNFGTYFRGEPQCSESLLPSIGRRQFYAGCSMTFDAAQERSMLHRFRRYAYAHFQRVPSEWESLFLARHHGLPTRLLDWTANPLVGLYFAAFHENDEITFRHEAEPSARMKLELDGTVWGIQLRRGHAELDVFDPQVSPLDVAGIRLVRPFYPTPRMTAQAGVFTLHGDPWSDVVKSAGRSYREQDLDIAKIKRWSVTSACKAKVIVDLERLSINSRTLFPDLEGLAKGLWQGEIIRQAPRD